MGGVPFKDWSVKTAPATAVCIALHGRLNCLMQTRFLQAHPPMSRLAPVIFTVFLCESGHGRGSIQDLGRQNSPGDSRLHSLSWPPQLSPADALLQAHPPISRLTPVFYCIFLCESGHGRESIQGVTRQNSPGGSRLHSLFRTASTVSCRRAFASAPTHVPAHTGHFTVFLCESGYGREHIQAYAFKTDPAAAVCIAFHGRLNCLMQTRFCKRTRPYPGSRRCCDHLSSLSSSSVLLSNPW